MSESVLEAKDSRAATPSEASAGGLRVFISYSRADVTFAEELELALRDKGHTPLVDRHGIDAGDDWQVRLGELILGCDTVVFVLTASSAKSAICKWEVEEAERIGRRLLVVTPAEVPSDVTPPQQLVQINWIPCWRNPAIPGSSQTKGFIGLDAALRTNAKWVRMRAWLDERAAEWMASEFGAESVSDNSGLLLRASVLDEALNLAKQATADAPLSARARRFLDESVTHEAALLALAKEDEIARVRAQERAIAAEQLMRKARKQRNWSVVVSALMAFLGAVAGFASFVAIREAELAKTAREEAEYSKAIAERDRQAAVQSADAARLMQTAVDRLGEELRIVKAENEALKARVGDEPAAE